MSGVERLENSLASTLLLSFNSPSGAPFEGGPIFRCSKNLVTDILD
jgi:hypothetical protein